MDTAVKNILLAVAAIAVAVGIWWIIKQPTSPGYQAEVLEASFVCSDQSHFIAQFAADDSVKILVDGIVIKALPLSAGEGKRYEDNTMLYVFAGEEASVANKSTNTIVVCSQPVDPNRAPVNFGDAGEGGGVKPDLILVVSESIVGKWQSAEDPKFTREFKSTGVAEDWYEGKAVSSGSWKVFSKEQPLSVSFPLQADATYLQITMSGSQAEHLNFRVSKLTPEALELVYMDRGGVSVFSRVK